MTALPAAALDTKAMGTYVTTRSHSVVEQGTGL